MIVVGPDGLILGSNNKALCFGVIIIIIIIIVNIFSAINK